MGSDRDSDRYRGQFLWFVVVSPGVPIGLLIVLAPLLGGTADRPYTLALAAASALGALLAVRRTAPRASLFHLFLGVALVATLLQLVPLPTGLRRLLCPGDDADLRQIVAELGGLGRRWPVSSDPGATLHEAVRLAGYLCLLFALGVTLDRPDGQERQRAEQSVRAALLAGALLCAGLGLLAGLGVPLPAPVAVPGGGATRALFPAGLYNSNHQAALVGLGALLSLDAAGRAEQRSARLGLLAACLLCDVVLLGTLSRAGILVWLAAQGALLLRDRRERPLAALLPPLCLILVALAGYLWLSDAALPRLHGRFAASDTAALLAPGGKLHAWRESWPLLAGHWALGVGRGAFENAFQHIQSQAGRTRFVYLENEWLQTVIDWGVPTGLVLTGLLVLAARDAWRRATPERPLASAALLGLGALFVHNLFDFNLEVGGLAVPAVALAALCQTPRFSVGRWLPATLAIVTLGGALCCVRGAPSHDEDGARLRSLVDSERITPDQVVAAGSAAVLRHPFDSYLSALVAARLVADAERAAAPETGARLQAQAVAWVNRALLANGHDVLAQQVGARLLLDRGYRTQGLLLLRGALTDADESEQRQLLLRLAAWADGPDELFAALPSPTLVPPLLELMVTSPAPRWERVRAVGLEARRRGLAGTAVWLGRAALALHDGATARLAARGLLDAGGAPPARLFADLVDRIADDGGASEAEELARQALARGEQSEVLVSLALLADRRRGTDEARHFLDRALERTSDDGPLRGRIHEVYGDVEAHAGNLHRATAHRIEAARLSARP